MPWYPATRAKAMSVSNRSPTIQVGAGGQERFQGLDHGWVGFAADDGADPGGGLDRGQDRSGAGDIRPGRGEGAIVVGGDEAGSHGHRVTGALPHRFVVERPVEADEYGARLARNRSSWPIAAGRQRGVDPRFPDDQDRGVALDQDPCRRMAPMSRSARGPEAGPGSCPVDRPRSSAGRVEFVGCDDGPRPAEPTAMIAAAAPGTASPPMVRHPSTSTHDIARTRQCGYNGFSHAASLPGDTARTP